MEKIRIRCGDKNIVVCDEKDAVNEIAAAVSKLEDGQFIKIERIVVEEETTVESAPDAPSGEGVSVNVAVDPLKLNAKANS